MCEINYEQFVLGHHPDAYLRRAGTNFMVVRPRRDSDYQSILPFVSLSRPLPEKELAWRDAMLRIQNEKRIAM